MAVGGFIIVCLSFCLSSLIGIVCRLVAPSSSAGFVVESPQFAATHQDVPTGPLQGTFMSSPLVAQPAAPLLAGSVARTMAVLCTSPLELVRTRMQAVFHSQPAAAAGQRQAVSMWQQVGQMDGRPDGQTDRQQAVSIRQQARRQTDRQTDRQTTVSMWQQVGQIDRQASGAGGQAGGVLPPVGMSAIGVSTRS
jgi:Mitochondrial carrier protein